MTTLTTPPLISFSPSGAVTGPHVAGDLPGPRSAELLARQDRWESAARVYPRHLPIALADGDGPYVRDVDGNVFIDFLDGAGVLPLGHNHPELLRAAARQLGVLTHGLDFPTPVKDAFTQAQLSMLAPGMRHRTKIHFCGPTGANAVEAAVKLCKIATGRSDVVAFQGAFHGTTYATTALSGPVARKDAVPGGMSGVHFFPYCGPGRCPEGPGPDGCSRHCADQLERALTDATSGVPLPAAVLIELVQGEGGSVPARTAFIRRIRELTRALDIPLIADEVQTGCGRTGTWFAFEQYGIEPDVIVASKALSGIGLPVALILYDAALDVWEPGAHIGTFRGDQPAFAAGVETVRIMRRDDVLGNVRARGRQCAELLAPLADHPWVRDVRGRGLIRGVELADPADGRPATEAAAAVQALALRHGLITELGGRGDAVVRLLPPLDVTAEVVGTACAILRDAVTAACRPRPGAAF
ncbi:aspartate aminotransferase family protein [Streptomyces sp. BBFR2]|uniref:aspartate aminotransferase family protein n=1 Tax=Streptomyces sp. BBFR2 TaxID=3372854 RepID=UPI0037D9EFCE